jgi:hypothetical protein
MQEPIDDNKTIQQQQKHGTNKFVIDINLHPNKLKLVRTDQLILVRMYFFYYCYVQSSKNSSYKSGQVPALYVQGMNLLRHVHVTSYINTKTVLLLKNMKNKL